MLSLKQFVPSEVCLKCDGCCRYKQADSVWRPKLGQAEGAQLAEMINAADALDAKGYVQTIQECGKHFCRFLNRTDNTCGVYGKRPLECSLYPFVLSQTPGAVKVYVHLSCPYIQDHLGQKDYEDHLAYLKKFFQREDVRAFLSENKAMFHDYSFFAPELLYLFDLLYL